MIEADSPRQARQYLRDRELAPLAVRETFGRGETAATGGPAAWFAPRLPVRELSLFTRQLATLVAAALPVEEALLALSEQTEKPRVRRLLMGLRGKVLEGFALAAAFGEYPRAFPVLYRATVAAGEAAGHLDLVLLRLAEYLEARQLARQKLLQALAYPLLLLVVSLLILVGLLTYVVPDLVEIFAETDQSLPALTLGLIAVSGFVQQWGLLLAVACLLPFLLLLSALRQPELRRLWHGWLLRLPLIGNLNRGLNAARFTGTLAILTSSGVPLVDAMRIAGQVLGNSFLAGKLAEATEVVSEGGSLHLALRQCGCFPPLMLHMIASGESSGELDQLLTRTAAHLQEDVNTLAGILLNLLGPLLLLTMGGLILVMVMAVLLPVMSWNQLVL